MLAGNTNRSFLSKAIGSLQRFIGQNPENRHMTSLIYDEYAFSQAAHAADTLKKAMEEGIRERSLLIWRGSAENGTAAYARLIAFLTGFEYKCIDLSSCRLHHCIEKQRITC